MQSSPNSDHFPNIRAIIVNFPKNSALSNSRVGAFPRASMPGIHQACQVCFFLLRKRSTEAVAAQGKRRWNDGNGDHGKYMIKSNISPYGCISSQTFLGHIASPNKQIVEKKLQCFAFSFCGLSHCPVDSPCHGYASLQIGKHISRIGKNFFGLMMEVLIPNMAVWMFQMVSFSMPSQMDWRFGYFADPSKFTRPKHAIPGNFLLSHPHFSLRHPGLFVLVQVKLGNPGSDAAAAGWGTCGAVVL